MVVTLTDPERQLLERLAAEGQASRLLAEDLHLAKSLEEVGLVFLVQANLGSEAAYAVITPKGRRLLVDLNPPKKPGKPPLGFLD
jgi:FixJ family two-component response regulator